MATPDGDTPAPVLDALPGVEEVLECAHVVRIPLHVRFRGVTEREAVLLNGPHGWGEFAPFPEYDDAESARWLACAVESAWRPPVPLVRHDVPVNATVPAVPAAEVPGVLARFDGCTTAKVKVAERGQTLADDVARLTEVRAALGPAGRIRIDANGAWDVDAAVVALTALARFDLEYAEQPCPTLDELARLRGRLARAGLDVPVAADESVRRASDPLRLAMAGAADVVVVKVAPLGGVRPALRVAARLGDVHRIPVVVSSALDTSVGLAAGLRLAAALPELPFACGLGTGALLADDVTPTPPPLRQGRIAVAEVVPDRWSLQRLAADDECTRWWQDRLRRCHAVLADPDRIHER